MLRLGADPKKKLSPKNSHVHQVWKRDDVEQTMVEVPCKSHSPLTFLFVLLEAFRKSKGGASWSARIGYLERALSVMTSTAAARKPKVPVHQSVVDVWHSVQDMTSTHNVIFETADGKVSAHAMVLTAASPVLKAMLESSMKEGSSKRIEVKDSCKGCVSLFLDILYMSSTCN